MIVEPDFLDHWKTQLLVQLLNDERAPLYLIRLWGHCQQRKTHRFPAGSKKLLAAVCKYPVAGRISPEQFHDCMIESGFVNIDNHDGEDIIVVHDWDVSNSSLVASWNNGKKGGRPRKPRKQETKNKPTGLPGDNPQDAHGLTDREDREDREEGESIALPDLHAEFQDVHPECERVTLQEFEAKIAAYRFMHDGEAHTPDVAAALADFRLNCASMQSFRPQGVMQKWGNYLQRAADDALATLKASTKKETTSRVHPALLQSAGKAQRAG